MAGRSPLVITGRQAQAFEADDPVFLLCERHLDDTISKPDAQTLNE